MAHRIHQELVFEAAPERVFEALIDERRFSEARGGAPTHIDPKPGGEFSCFGGMIVGRNIECAPGERLVQAWRVKTWEPGLYSLARFELRREGNATRLVFDHTGFPEDQSEHLSQGWHANYWEPLRKSLA